MTISQFPIPAGGIPTGDTAGRPASPSIGDVYYNGEKAILEIFDGTNFVPCSAPAAAPTIAVADVGTSVAYGSAQGAVTITEGTSGGPADTFLISASTGGYTATTTGTTVTITVGNNGSYTFSGQGINNFGTSVAGPSTSATLTTVPQAPTIGTATTSAATSDVTVTWTLGQNGGKNLSSITITPYLNGTTAQTSQTAATTSSTTHTFTGLTQGSAYTFKVKATNANGAGLESSATNSVTIPTFFNVSYLVIAGGGAGGGYQSGVEHGGGGGAGGYRNSVSGETTGGGGSAESVLSLSGGTNYTVTVGGGGSPGSAQAKGGEGSNSVFSTITSTGGGGGGGATETGGTGGSGGGRNGARTSSPVQGFAGGANAGGGGGAGEAGSTDAYNAGGDGLASSITGSSVTRGGGGGGGDQGVGGDGGGGDGGKSGATGGTAGTANTGGGGGGAALSGTPGTLAGAAGGSGVVILRYPDTRTITIGAGLTGTESSASGGFKRATLTAGSGNVSWS
jgi:hypothetical protein